jgi:MYXO-CTERM domain-containing protein
MSTGETGRKGRRAALALAVLGALGLSACGEEDFPNKSRPPAPIDVTAKVDAKKVLVSPDKFGAGLVNFTIANLSDSPVRFTLSGPEDAATPAIQPGAPATLKVDLTEGSYRATAGADSSARPDRISVGPERKSSQNTLLLP